MSLWKTFGAEFVPRVRALAKRLRPPTLNGIPSSPPLVTLGLPRTRHFALDHWRWSRFQQDPSFLFPSSHADAKSKQREHCLSLIFHFSAWLLSRPLSLCLRAKPMRFVTRRDKKNMIHINQNPRLRKKKFFLLHAWISLDSPWKLTSLKVGTKMPSLHFSRALWSVWLQACTCFLVKMWRSLKELQTLDRLKNCPKLNYHNF